MVGKTIKKKSSKTIAKSKTTKKAAPKRKAAKPRVVKKVALKKRVVAKKAAPKKKAVKKRKVTAKKNPMNKRLKPEQYFYMRDGTVLKGINDLAKMMDEFEDEVFNHHVNDERHDFANWIENVFEEADLARQLNESEKNKHMNHYIVLKYVFKKK